jgi:hypothetical protein
MFPDDATQFMNSPMNGMGIFFEADIQVKE